MLLKIIVVTLVAFDLSSYKYQHVRNERDGKLCCLNKPPNCMSLMYDLSRVKHDTMQLNSSA